MIEIWKDIPGYEGLYKASNTGKIYSIANKRELISKSPAGYLYVGLRKDGFKKTVAVHRLIAKTFLPNPENKPEVHHKDHNAQNNRIDNLEWITPEENKSEYYHSDKFKESQKQHKASRRKRDPKQELIAFILSLTEEQAEKLLNELPKIQALIN